MKEVKHHQLLISQKKVSILKEISFEKLILEFKEISRIDEYKEGLRYAIDKKYEQAESYFRKSLDHLLQNEEIFNPKAMLLIQNKYFLTVNYGLT